MRKASSTLFSHLTRHKPPLSLLSRSITTTTTSNISSRINHLIPCTRRTHNLLLSPNKSHQSHTNPSRNLNTLVGNHPQTSSTCPETKEKSDLVAAFESAKTTEQMVKAFKDMESVLDEGYLGSASLKVGLKLDKEGEDPEKTLSFATKAYNAFNRDGELSLPLAMSLQLMGSACFNLNRFSDSLGYLNKANKVLGRLEVGGFRGDFRPVLHAVQLELANVKTAMGRREEALGNLRKSLEIKEVILEKDSRELGVANRNMAEACVAILNFEEALPYCLKALEMHTEQLGNNSVEVAHDRRVLAVIYSGLEEHEKALEQNELSQKVLKSWGLTSDLLRAEINAANLQIALGKHEEAIDSLKGVVLQTDRESEIRAMVFIVMGKALCNQEKFVDAKRCLEIACGILDKKETVSPLEVSEAYIEVSMQYETMKDFEIAISLLKRALAILEKLPEEQPSEGSVSARIGWLLLFTGKASQAIPFLESAVERLKESFGPKHFGVGYIYNNLGTAYLELDRPQSAVQMFSAAKGVMDISLGSHHPDSIETCQNLSKAYGAMEDYPLAFGFQQQVVEALESHGSIVRDELREAKWVLEQLKKKNTNASYKQALSKAMPLAHEKQLSIV